MIRKDLHIHTTFSDGKNTPEEMVLSAINKGFTTIGFSDHGYTSFDESYCIQKGKQNAYRTEILRLREKYRDRITVLCGIEQDYYGGKPDAEYDYIIGSVHYFRFGADYIPVDENAQTVLQAARKYCGGDVYALAENYYAAVADVVRQTGTTVIGHFDLLTKFNEQTPLFDETHPRYIAAWQSAADKLLEANIPFEINTGAISRGYRTTPYPSESIRKYLAERGAQFVLSSDSHSAETIGYKFDVWQRVIE